MNKKILISIMIFLAMFQFAALLAPARLLAAPNKAATDALNFLDDTAVKAGLTKTTSGEDKTLAIIGNIINILLGFIGILFFIQIFWAGIKWMTSAGNEEVVKSSRQTIQNAIIGIVIVFSAFVITNFVLNQIQSITGGQTSPTATEQPESGWGCCVTTPTDPNSELIYRKVNSQTECTGSSDTYIPTAIEGTVCQ